VSDTGKPNVDDQFTLPSANDRVFIAASHPYRGFYEKFYGRNYLQGYEEAADILFEQAQFRLAEDPETPLDVANWLVYPIYFLYRHAIELSLKQMRDEHIAGSVTASRNDHDLLHLWRGVKGWVEGIGGDELQAETKAFERLIEQIQRVDPRGDAGRYELHINRTETFKGLRPLDLPNLRNTMKKMVNFLALVSSKSLHSESYRQKELGREMLQQRKSERRKRERRKDVLPSTES
jgi:hypothetical protein